MAQHARELGSALKFSGKVASVVSTIVPLQGGAELRTFMRPQTVKRATATKTIGKGASARARVSKA